MEVNIKHEDAMIIAVKGRLDTVTSALLDEKIKQETIVEPLVIVDFSQVEYISSAGLRLLLALKRELDQEGKALEIHHINAVVQEIFKVTGFCNALTVK